MHTLRLLRAAQNETVYERRSERHRLRQLQCLERMPEDFFRQQFRFSKADFKRLCDEIKNLTNLKGTREIPVEVKVLCALCFFASGSYQRVVGVTQHLTQRTTSRCVREVADALSSTSIVKKYISFPQTSQERSQNEAEFRRKYSLPGVIGCIDCTHISIIKPKDDEQLFFNRKGYHSLNVQMVCNQNLEIIHVNSKFGGATHDSYVWSAGELEPYMRALNASGEHVWLLGDSAYPQRPWLMAPILNAAAGSREEIYNSRHVLARNCIERCFGLLKARWRCLLKDRTLHYHPVVASKITLACCVLHNIAVKANLPSVYFVRDDNGGSDVYGAQSSNSDANSQSELIRGRTMLNDLLTRL